MKKKIVIILMTIIVGGLLYFTGINTGKAYYYGPPAGATNSPYDGASCAYSGCHSSYALQSPKPWITSNIPSGGYAPNTIYTITAKAVNIGYTSFGFEISPQTPGGAPLGKLIATNTHTTQIAELSGSSGILQYIEQTQYGYQGTDSLVWTFNWKSPDSGTGSVTFYGCFNTGYGNSSPSGAYIFPATLFVPEYIAGVNNIEVKSTSFSVFPNPAQQQINITYALKESADVEVNIYGIDGRKISNLLNNSIKSEGEHTQQLFLSSAINKGVYIIQLIANGQSTMQRFVKE